MKVWKPPAENLPNFYDRLKEGIFYPYFFQLINISGYADKLAEFVGTMFVPIEHTADYILPETQKIIEKALKDENLARRIVENHLIDEPISLKEMLELKELLTVSGKKISIDVKCNIREDFEILIEDACYVEAYIDKNEIETANLVCHNGFIHTIKGIII